MDFELKSICTCRSLVYSQIVKFRPLQKTAGTSRSWIPACYVAAIIHMWDSDISKLPKVGLGFCSWPRWCHVSSLQTWKMYPYCLPHYPQKPQGQCFGNMSWHQIYNTENYLKKHIQKHIQNQNHQNFIEGCILALFPILCMCFSK